MYKHNLDAYALFWWSFYKLFSWLISSHLVIHVPQLGRTNYEIKSKTLKAGVMLYSFNPPLLPSVHFLNIVFDTFLFHFLSKHLVIMN